VRREWDAGQTESELKIAELERRISENDRNHQDEIVCLESKIQLLQSELADTSQVERLRVTQRERIELELRVKSMLQEIEEIRQESKLMLRAVKEGIRLEYEQEERTHKRQLVDLVSASKNVQAEKESLQAKCNILEEEVRITDRKKNELLEENNRLRKELDKNMSLLEENAHKHNMALSNAHMNLMKQKNESDHQIQDLCNKITSLKRYSCKFLT
jgi:hypothetical protein